MSQKSSISEIRGALILIAEDDPDIALILTSYLEREGLRTLRAADGDLAIALHHSQNPNLVLLDVNLPKADGFAVFNAIRRRAQTPVIFVTAMAEDIDKLAALRSGADDYVVKPFNPAEVVARAKAVLRRANNQTLPELYREGPIELDAGAHVVRVRTTDSGTHVLPLTLSEFRILKLLMSAPARVMPRGDILDVCFPDSDMQERTLDSHLSNLRRKLEQAGAPGYVASVRGVGYRLTGSAG